MAVPQPGIFAQGTRSHYHLEFDLRPDAADADICAAIGRLREPAVTVGGSNIIVGFGPTLWRRLQPENAPDDLADFRPIAGAHAAPATQHDVWAWTHGTGEDAGKDYKTVRHELEAYGHGLAGKPEIVALSKADALTPELLKEQVARLKRAAKKTPLVVSAAAQKGVPEVLRALLKVIDGERAASGEPAEAEAWHP